MLETSQFNLINVPLNSYRHLDYIGISDKHLYCTNLGGEFTGTLGLRSVNRFSNELDNSEVNIYSNLIKFLNKI
jgi:hypothetical protein